MPQFVKDYHDFYQTKRGYHPRSFGSTTGATLSSLLDFMAMPLLTYANEIDSPVLMLHGEKAHSRYIIVRMLSKNLLVTTRNFTSCQMRCILICTTRWM